MRNREQPQQEHQQDSQHDIGPGQVLPVGIVTKFTRLQDQFFKLSRDVRTHLKECQPPAAPTPGAVTTYHSPSIVQYYYFARDSDIAGPVSEQGNDGRPGKVSTGYMRNGNLSAPKDADKARSGLPGFGSYGDDEGRSNGATSSGLRQAGGSRQPGAHDAEDGEDEGREPVDTAGLAFAEAMRHQRPSLYVHDQVLAGFRGYSKEKVVDKPLVLEPPRHQPSSQPRATAEGGQPCQQIQGGPPIKSIEKHDNGLLEEAPDERNGDDEGEQTGGEGREAEEDELYASVSPGGRPRSIPRKDKQ